MRGTQAPQLRQCNTLGGISHCDYQQREGLSEENIKFPFGIHPRMTHSIKDTEWEHFHSHQDHRVPLFEIHGPGPYRHRRGSPLGNLQYLHCNLQTAACRGMQLPKGGIHQGMFSWLLLSTQENISLGNIKLTLWFHPHMVHCSKNSQWSNLHNLLQSSKTASVGKRGTDLFIRQMMKA